MFFANGQGDPSKGETDMCAGCDRCSAMERAVNQYRAQTGDREVFALRQEKQGADEKTGSQGHPNRERHEKMAEQLTAFIKELG